MPMKLHINNRYNRSSCRTLARSLFSHAVYSFASSWSNPIIHSCNAWWKRRIELLLRHKCLKQNCSQKNQEGNSLFLVARIYNYKLYLLVDI